MKPLSIKEMMNLPVGDWVYVVNLKTKKGTYAIMTDFNKPILADSQVYTLCPDYSDYNQKWIAYKNKEEYENKYETVND